MIPKIIHQIWIGPNSMPQNVQEYCRNTKSLFDDYNYMFWDNNNIPSMPDVCSAQFERYGKKAKYAFQADILRYYVLNKYGGIYLDVDFMCQKRFDHLITKNFFCVSPNLKGFHVCNGILACEKQNPILTKLLNELKNEPYHGPILLSKYISEFLNIEFKTHIYNYLQDNPHPYVQCMPPKEFFNRKQGCCYHEALKSWLPKKTKDNK